MQDNHWPAASMTVSLYPLNQMLAWYGGKLYLSTMLGLYTLQGGSLVEVDFGDDAPATCYHLSVADGVTWSFGAKDIMAFDSNTWIRID